MWIISMFTIFSCLIFSAHRGFAEELVQAEGKFYAQDDDDLNFVKQQLIYNATKEVISNELKALGHSPDEFWRIYEERFATYFAPIKEKLLKDFKINSEAEGSKNANFQKMLRVRLLSSKNIFGRLERAMLSYKINKISRATNSPNLRFMSISAKVDRIFINELYSAYTRKLDHKTYSTIYVSLELDLSQTQGEFFGISAQGEWEKSILDSWQKTLAGQLNNQLVEKVQIASGDLEISRLQKLLASTGNSSDSEEINKENAIWLQVKMKLVQKVAENSLSKFNLRVAGSTLLYAISGKKLLYYQDLSQDISGEVKTMSDVDKKILAAQIVSTVSNLPLTSFQGMEKLLANSSSLEKTVPIKVIGHKSIQDLIDLQQFLVQEGTSLELKTVMNYFALDGALLQITFVGTEDALKDFWRKVAGKNINSSLQINVESMGEVAPENVLVRLK